MDDRIVILHVYKDDELLSSKPIFSQWINVATDVYTDWEGSPYSLVIEYNGKVVRVDNAKN